jgi:hypothetical protein
VVEPQALLGILLLAQRVEAIVYLIYLIVEAGTRPAKDESREPRARFKLRRTRASQHGLGSCVPPGGVGFTTRINGPPDLVPLRRTG